MFAAFALLAVFYFRYGPKVESYEQKRANVRAEKLAALRKDEQEKLSDYKYADKQKGTVQIPIHRAMELTVAELQNKKPRASGVKVEAQYPFGLGQPAPGTAVIPPGLPPGAQPVAASPAPSPIAAPSPAAAAPPVKNGATGSPSPTSPPGP